MSITKGEIPRGYGANRLRRRIRQLLEAGARVAEKFLIRGAAVIGPEIAALPALPVAPAAPRHSPGRRS